MTRVILLLDRDSDGRQATPEDSRMTDAVTLSQHVQVVSAGLGVHRSIH